MIHAIENMDFNSGEFGPSDEPEPQPEVDVQAMINQMMLPKLAAPNEQEAVDESYLGEVDKRFEVARYWRDLLGAELFTPKTEESSIVERDVRNFAKGRLHLLMGIGNQPAPEVKLPFNENEIKILKILASWSETELNLLRTIVSKLTGSINKTEVKQEPSTVTTIQAKAKPTIAPRAVTPSKPQPQPEVKKKPGRPPSKPAGETVTVTDPVTGEEKQIKQVKRQVAPAGGIPFPTDLGTATQFKSMQQAEVVKKQSNVLDRAVMGG